MLEIIKILDFNGYAFSLIFKKFSVRRINNFASFYVNFNTV